MKRSLLLMASFLVFGYTFSQSLTLSNAEGSITPGSTVYVLGDPADDLIRVEIFVTNTTGAALDVKAKKVIAPGDTVTGTMNTFCWGVCFPPFIYVSPQPVTIGAGETYPEFDGDYTPYSHPGKSTIMYVFFVATDPNDSVAVNVEYNASSLGLDDRILSQSTISKAYPNPANSRVSIDYDLPEEQADARIIISNLLGNKVREATITGKKGKVDIAVDQLPDGIYFYSMMVNDRQLATKKFVVRH